MNRPILTIKKTDTPAVMSKPKSDKWLCQVPGRGPMRKVHLSLERAEKAAKDLIEKKGAPKVWICQVVGIARNTEEAEKERAGD